MKNKILKHLSTFGPIGYLPAPGTAASLAILPLVLWLKSFDVTLYFLITIIIWFASLYIIRKSLPFFHGKHDPNEIVIDEGANCFIALLFLPISWQSVSCAFLLFRVFDIFKPFGISHIDRKHGPLAIMLDDFYAALLVNILTQFLIWQHWI